jgi:hypothetical protein
MKKLSEGFINCLERGIDKGYIWDDDIIWVKKSYQKNERYTPKLEALGFIVKGKSYGFYYLTEEGIKLVNKLITNKP